MKTKDKAVILLVLVATSLLIFTLYLISISVEPSPYVKCCSKNNMSYVTIFGEPSVPDGMYCLKILSNKVIPINKVCPELK